MLISMDTQHRSFSRYKTKEPLLLIYGMPHAFELEAFNTDTDQPVDIQHLNLQLFRPFVFIVRFFGKGYL